MLGWLLTTRDTVMCETPAAAATCRMLGRAGNVWSLIGTPFPDIVTARWRSSAGQEPVWHHCRESAWSQRNGHPARGGRRHRGRGCRTRASALDQREDRALHEVDDEHDGDHVHQRVDLLGPA